METIFAPTYATLTMGCFEVHFYNLRTQMVKRISNILEYWNRFLDDCQTPLDKNKVKPE